MRRTCEKFLDGLFCFASLQGVANLESLEHPVAGNKINSSKPATTGFNTVSMPITTAQHNATEWELSSFSKLPEVSTTRTQRRQAAANKMWQSFRFPLPLAPRVRFFSILNWYPFVLPSETSVMSQTNECQPVLLLPFWNKVLSFCSGVSSDCLLVHAICSSPLLVSHLSFACMFARMQAKTPRPFSLETHGG